MTTLTHALASALVDFLWQAVLVVLPVAGVLRTLAHRSPQLRYAISTTALLVLIALPIVTTVSRDIRVLAGEVVPISGNQSMLIAAVEGRFVALPPDPSPHFSSLLARVEPWVLPVWLAGVLLLSLRLVAGGVQVHALRRTGQPVDDELYERVRRLASRMGVHHPIRLVTSPHADGPSAIGWLRPLILLPPAHTMGLTIEQLEALLAHELAHIRRHDYLVNIVQMVAETLLFYHPAVWWVSKRLRIERELCCDEEAVRACGDAATYARALLSLAKLQSPAMVMGSTGGSLTDRVRVLLGLRVAVPHRPATLWAAAATAVSIAVAIASMDAQAERLRFEVASVKPAPGEAIGYRGIAFLPGGVVRGAHVPLSFLITRAFGLSAKQLVSDSDLLKERFDIEARAEVRALPAEGATIEQTILRQSPALKEMLQTLLRERFNLMIHVEKRDSPVYALVVGARGHKLTPASGDCGPRTVDEAAVGGSPCGFQGGGPARGLHLHGVDLSSFAGALTAFTDRFVVDRTGIQGRFDIDLPSWSTGAPPRLQDGGVVQEPQPDANDPSIFTLIQERLGLRLESTRAPIDIYIVDHVERPTPN